MSRGHCTCLLKCKGICNYVPFANLSVGDKFSTFEELERKIQDVQDATNVQLWYRDSRTLEGAKRRYPVAVSKANTRLKYYTITLACVCGGRKHSDKRSGKGENAPCRKVT